MEPYAISRGRGRRDRPLSRMALKGGKDVKYLRAGGGAGRAVLSACRKGHEGKRKKWEEKM